MHRLAPVLAVALALVATASSRARAEAPAPPGAAGIEILDRRGADLPRDVKLTDHEGHEVTLGSYFDGDRPVVLVLAYYQCPMLCTLVLNQLKTGLSGLAWTAGKEFRVVTVSIDPRDKAEDAKAKRANYLKAYGRDVGDKGWDFLVGDEKEVRRLADAVGFRYRWEESTKQFAHAAGAFIATPSGRLSQTLYGLEFPPSTLRFALTEASAGKLGSTIDRVLLLCYHYDAAAQSYVIARAKLAMSLGGALTVIVLAGWLARLWQAEARRLGPKPEEAPSA